MKKRPIVILLAVCLLTGCGEAKKAITDITDDNNMSKTETDVAQIPTNQPDYEGIKIYTEEDFEDEDYYDYEDEDSDEEIASRDLSDIIYPVEGKVYNEVKSSKKKKKNEQEKVFDDAPLFENDKGEIFASGDNNYKSILFEELEKNLEQKKFRGKCVKVEDYKIELYNIAQIHDGDVNDIDLEFKSVQDNMSNIEYSGVKYNMYYKNKAKNKTYIFRVEGSEFCDMEVDTGDASITPHAISNNYIAIALRYDEELQICIIDLSINKNEVINFSNVISKTFYGESNYRWHEDILELTFVDDNKLALKFKSGQIVVYDINNETVTDIIKTARVPEVDDMVDIANAKYDISLDDGICNLTYKNDDETYDYYAIDLDTMQIVSHVENPDRYFIDFMGLYKDGVTYFTNSYGLYAYNPETKGYDCIYDQMENDTEYTWEKIKDDKYRDVFVKPLFKGNDIYLCRGIRQADDCIDWKEAICKKLTIK